MTATLMNHGQCLTDETLTDYLEGGLDPAVRVASETHLVRCDDCRVKLAFFMRLLKEEVEPEEELTLNAIQAEWNRAQRDQRLPGRQRTANRTWKIASGGVAAALLLAAGARVVMDRASEPRSADEVIQLLMAESRPFEARISGQPHRPFASQKRGAADSGASYNLLAGQLNRLAATPYEMGQFYLLQKNFTQAIRYLSGAEQEPGASAAVHNDLGVAYMESGNPADLQRAIAEFRHALSLKSDFAPAAFNLAVLYARLGDERAEEQWKLFLQRESDPQWKDEAQTRLEGIHH